MHTPLGPRNLFERRLFGRCLNIIINGDSACLKKDTLPVGPRFFESCLNTALFRAKMLESWYSWLSELAVVFLIPGMCSAVGVILLCKAYCNICLVISVRVVTLLYPSFLSGLLCSCLRCRWPPYMSFVKDSSVSSAALRSRTFMCICSSSRFHNPRLKILSIYTLAQAFLWGIKGYG